MKFLFGDQMFINYSDIPGHQNLFLDYLYEFENVAGYYKKNFRNEDNFENHFNEVVSSYKINRNELCKILKDQYSGFSPSIQTQNNIEHLSSQKTMAIVTGQQLGILGGPLYTFYKIITAIKLANNLKEKYNRHFVPVFWLEGDDHDLDEVSYTNLVDEHNELKEFKYIHNSEDEFQNRESVGEIKFNKNIEEVLNELKNFLRDTEFKPKVLELITKFYKEGKTFKQSFKELIFNFFDEYGLLIFDPQDPEIKSLLKPIFKNEIDSFREHTNEIVKISANLEEVYHAQVKVNPVNLFYYDEDGRFLIEPVDTENEFRLKGKRKRFSKNDILFLIEKHPERFSPNVLMRPVCQDYILPTAFYIAGPGEISYFAQVIPLYKYFKIAPPIIYPRASVTIAERFIKKVLEKFDLNYENIFTEKEELISKVIKQNSEVDVEEEFKILENKLIEEIEKSKSKFITIDKTLADLSDKTREQILQNLNRYHEKVSEAQKKRHEITLRQINKAYNIMFPGFNLQERELNFIYFANKYGLEIIKLLMNEISINKFEHQIIEI